MKDILSNYPIKILQQELINIRTSYRLEKKRIIEILRDMKSIKKLTKEQLIDLLIKYNYDISKLPNLEDLIKPKEKKVKKKEIKTKRKDELEKKKKELLKRKEELLKIKKELEKNKLFNIDDEQSLNIYIAVKKENIGYDKEIVDKLINNNKLIIELKKDISKETNYDNFLNLKNKIEELYKEINQYELILDKQSKEIEKKRIKELKPNEPKKNKEEPKKDINKIIDIPEKNKKLTTDEYIEIQDNLSKDIEKYLPLYIPLFNMNSLLGLLKIGRQDIKMLNIFLTPQSVAKKLIDFSNINNDNKKDTFDILEPTAGTGNLIAELVKENPEKYNIDAIEAVKEIYMIGKARFNNFNNIIWQHTNFLNYKTDKKYDYIFMNPPFNINVRGKQVNDIDFINYAYNFLKEDGKICALISISFLTNSKPKYKKFKEFIENNNIETLEINEGFKEDKTIAKEMQTKVKMIIVIINKIKGIETIF